jgi:hypothetical protein
MTAVANLLIPRLGRKGGGKEERVKNDVKKELKRTVFLLAVSTVERNATRSALE